MMNFFEEQARAKQKTTQLLFLFPLAILGLCLLLYGFLYLFSMYLGDPGYVYGFHLDFVYLSAITIGVIVIGSIYKARQLKAGGSAVAEALGGKPLSSTSLPPEEQRLRNIVEEMAIASGIPSPRIYILEESSINAFAAGLTPQDAAIGVTRAAITLLSRDELQGVIAHEFSHILYGDMRLNTRLVGVLHGILILSLAGKSILQGLGSQARMTRNNKSKEANWVAGAITLFALILIICGSIGVFFANLIKSAIARQREFLADAAAVQFTRNPAGIAGALKKIGGYKQNTDLAANRAAEFSHMYFTDGVSPILVRYSATHPPLRERISRIEPRWNQRFIDVTDPAVPPEGGKDIAVDAAPVFIGFAGSGNPAQHAPDYSTSSAEQALLATGSPQKEHLTAAQTILHNIPAPLKEATYKPESAQTLVYLFLLHPQQEQREEQLQLLQPRLSPEALATLHHLYQLVPVVDKRYRLPLLSLTLPSLRECSGEQIKDFLENLHLLAEADRRVNLMEWCLIRILESSLQQPQPTRSQYRLTDLPEDIALMLSTLAYAGSGNEDLAQQAFNHAGKTLYPELKQELSLTKISGLKNINNALNNLKALFPLQKPLLLKAMVQCISHDDHVSVAEAELLRAVASSIDCPVPPFPGQNPIT